MALVQRCKAYESADRAAQIRGQYDQKVALASDKRNNYSNHERKEFKQEAVELLQQFKLEMVKAGKLFCDIDMNEHAAQCFFSAGDLDNSAELFLRQGKFGPTAECYYKLGQIKKAAEYYSKAKLFTNAFQCYEQLEDWDGLIQCLYKFREQFGSKEWSNLLEKYLPIALNSVYQLYS